MIKAYKGFHEDLTCTLGRGTFQYEENKWIEEPEELGANCVRNGFHCCYDPLDCLNYYRDFERSAYYVVNADGDIHEDGRDTKIACTRIKLVKRLSMEEFVAHALIYMAQHPYLKPNAMVKSEDAHGTSRNGFWIVRGKNPVCAAPMGTIVGMAREAVNSKEITDMTVYKVDGERYRQNVAYLVDGKEASW